MLALHTQVHPAVGSGLEHWGMSREPGMQPTVIHSHEIAEQQEGVGQRAD